MNGDLSPYALKKLSGTHTVDERITDEELTVIGRALKVQFVIHEPQIDAGKVKRFGERRNAFQLHLYLAHGHYTVCTERFDLTIVDAFARASEYRLIQLGQQLNCFNADRDLAIRLANELNQAPMQQIEEDRALAERLQQKQYD